MATGGTGSTPAQDRDGSVAVKTAIVAVAGIAALELDHSDRRQACEVDVISGDTEQEVRVSPGGNEVIEQRESGSAESEDVSDLGASVLMSDAIGTALAEVPGHRCCEREADPLTRGSGFIGTVLRPDGAGDPYRWIVRDDSDHNSMT